MYVCMDTLSLPEMAYKNCNNTNKQCCCCATSVLLMKLMEKNLKNFVFFVFRRHFNMRQA